MLRLAEPNDVGLINDISRFTYLASTQAVSYEGGVWMINILNLS